MRNLSFSLFFPSYHQRKGQPTFFGEKIKNGNKKHTIRKVHKFPFFVGDVFQPVYWEGKPYNSKILNLCNPLSVAQTFTFEKNGMVVKVDGLTTDLEIVARNDGLSIADFLAWFPERHFSGYIITWVKMDYPKNDNYSLNLSPPPYQNPLF